MIADIYQGVFDTCYEIVWRDRLPKFGVQQRQAKGYIDPINDRIVIRRGMDPKESAITLLHEVTHECYPEWCENDVEACAQYTYSQLSDDDRAVVSFLATDPTTLAVR